jgi:exportin-2 (importin alpha re-exporter)
LPTIDEEIAMVKSKKPAASKKTKNSHDSHDDSSSNPSSAPAVQKDYSRTPFNQQKRKSTKSEESTTEITSPTKRLKADDDDYDAHNFSSPTISTSRVQPPSKIQARNIITKGQQNFSPVIDKPQVDSSFLTNRYKDIRASPLKFDFLGLGMMGQELVEQLSQQIAGILAKTFSPDVTVRKAAEEELVRLETTSQLYGLATLYLTRLTELSREVHISAAIAFKNFIRRNWRYDPTDENLDQVDRIDAQQRELIKQHITKFMLESPSHIQRQLSEAITIIGQSDFPDKWPSLIVELETFLKQDLNQNFHTIQGVLQTAHSIFRRYRYELQSNRLWAEIKLVIEHFGQPLTDRFKDLCMASKNVAGDVNTAQPVYQSILLCTEIYHSLVTQDLPEFFEDRLNQWLPLFLDLLTVRVDMPDGVTVIEDLKSEICEIASLFVQRYSDAENSKEFIQKFAENIWTLLVTTSQDMKYDTLVSNAIRYLVTVAERPETRPLFQDANVLNLLCQNVIIPNLTLRDIDQELFDDDPEEYVKRDIEGSDVDTRRRAACDLVQALCKFQEAQLIEVFGRFIEGMLEKYRAEPNAHWQRKDLSIFLYSAMAIKGSTRQHGTVSVSHHVNVEKFFEDNIVCELVNESQGLGPNILKADALRYVTTFRNHISLSTLSARLPVIIKHIMSSNIVIRTYASIALEKLLTMRDPAQPKQTAFKPEQFEPLVADLIQALFQALDMPGTLENDHIMKAIMKLFSFSKSTLMVQFLPVVVPKLTNKLGIVARNPSNPYFNHYLFETLALTIRAACSQENPAMRNDFENVLFNILEVVLAQDVQEFTPYVLQLLNLILLVQSPGAVSEKFMKLFYDLLSPTHWEKPANIRPLTELMHTYIEKIGQMIITQNKLDALLGIFQKLIASKATDHEGLALLQTMMVHLPAADLDAKIKDIFALIFQRLTCSKTTKFVKHVLICFSTYAFLRGADALACAVNQLQDKIFGMVLEKLYIADVKKVTGYAERRVCVCGMIRIISQLPLIENGSYNHIWSPLLLVLLEIFELPQEIVADEDDHFKDITETLDFQAQYSRLSYATVKREDPTKDVGDLKLLLATSMASLSSKMPGFVSRMINDHLNPTAATCLMNYCQAANVTIS